MKVVVMAVSWDLMTAFQMVTTRAGWTVVKTAGSKVSHMAAEMEIAWVQWSAVMMAVDLDEIQAAELVNMMAFEMVYKLVLKMEEMTVDLKGLK